MPQRELPCFQHFNLNMQLEVILLKHALVDLLLEWCVSSFYPFAQTLQWCPAIFWIKTKDPRPDLCFSAWCSSSLTSLQSSQPLCSSSNKRLAPASGPLNTLFLEKWLVSLCYLLPSSPPLDCKHHEDRGLSLYFVHRSISSVSNSARHIAVTWHIYL